MSYSNEELSVSVIQLFSFSTQTLQNRHLENQETFQLIDEVTHNFLDSLSNERV